MQLEPLLSEEAELVERAKTDEAAFEMLYHNYFDRIYGFTYKRVGNVEETQDIVSTTFMKAFSSLTSYQNQNCPFKAWLYRIATNCIIDFFRKNGRSHVITVEELPEVVDITQNHLETVIKNDEARQVRIVLAELAPKYQQVLQLKFFGELSNGEIAEVLGVSANNAGVIIYRALESFQKKYQSYYV